MRQIIDHPAQNEIDKIFHHFYKTQIVTESDNPYESLGKLDDIKIIEKRKWDQDFINQECCEWYVFKTESWWAEYSSQFLDVYMSDAERANRDLWFNTQKFLKSYGYSHIKNPIKDCIVTYISRVPEIVSFGKPPANADYRLVHVGFWKGKNAVLSKWGPGYVFKHHFSAVPRKDYGSEVWFFKKAD